VGRLNGGEGAEGWLLKKGGPSPSFSKKSFPLKRATQGEHGKEEKNCPRECKKKRFTASLLRVGRFIGRKHGGRNGGEKKPGHGRRKGKKIRIPRRSSSFLGKGKEATGGKVLTPGKGKFGGIGKQAHVSLNGRKSEGSQKKKKCVLQEKARKCSWEASGHIMEKGKGGREKTTLGTGRQKKIKVCGELKQKGGIKRKGGGGRKKSPQKRNSCGPQRRKKKTRLG